MKWWVFEFYFFISQNGPAGGPIAGPFRPKGEIPRSDRVFTSHERVYGRRFLLNLRRLTHTWCSTVPSASRPARTSPWRAATRSTWSASSAGTSGQTPARSAAPKWLASCPCTRPSSRGAPSCRRTPPGPSYGRTPASRRRCSLLNEWLLERKLSWEPVKHSHETFARFRPFHTA